MASSCIDDPLTAEQLRASLDYDPEIGTFTWRHRPNLRPSINSRLVGMTAGTPIANGYITIVIMHKHHYAHRLAWLHVTGAMPEADIDHIDGDRKNNRWLNLRQATRSQNNMNQKAQQRSKSGLKGVYWHVKAGKWAAQIVVNKEHHYLGLFDTAEAAHAAYREAASRLHGKFARTS